MRDPSLERRNPASFLKVVMLLPWDLPSTTLGTILRTNTRDVFTEMTETGLDLKMVLADDTLVRAVGHGTFSFERESIEPMILSDVLYVSGLKKNLVSVSTIEDRDFGVYVLDGKVCVFPKVTGPSTSYAIGVRCGKLYKLLF